MEHYRPELPHNHSDVQRRPEAPQGGVDEEQQPAASSGNSLHLGRRFHGHSSAETRRTSRELSAEQSHSFTPCLHVRPGGMEFPPLPSTLASSASLKPWRRAESESLPGGHAASKERTEQRGQWGQGAAEGRRPGRSSPDAKQGLVSVASPAPEAERGLASAASPAPEAERGLASAASPAPQAERGLASAASSAPQVERRLASAASPAREAERGLISTASPAPQAEQGSASTATLVVAADEGEGGPGSELARSGPALPWLHAVWHRLGRLFTWRPREAAPRSAAVRQQGSGRSAQQLRLATEEAAAEAGGDLLVWLREAPVGLPRGGAR